MSEYQITVVHRSGREHIVADFLSRNICPDPLLDQKTSLTAMMVRLGPAPKRRGSPGKRRRLEEGAKQGPRVDDAEQTEEIDVERLPSARAEGMGTYEEWKAQTEVIMREPIVLGLGEELMGDLPVTVPEEEDVVFPPCHWFRDVEGPVTIEDIRAQQLKDDIKQMKRGMARDAQGFITYLGGAWVPVVLREKVLDFFHLALPFWHPGTRKMASLCKGRFTWEGQSGDLARYVAGCLTCQRTRTGAFLPTSTGMHPVDGPFETTYVDFWGPVPWRGRLQLFLTMIDYHTKWAELAGVKDRKAASITQAWFRQWVSRFGSPRRIITDREKPFISDAFKELAAVLGSMKLESTSYHPEGNAPIESFHRTMALALQKIRQRYEECMSLEEAIAWAMFGYRAQPHTATGYSPGYLTYGMDPRVATNAEVPGRVRDVVSQGRIALLGDIRNEVCERGAKAQAAFVLPTRWSNLRD